MGPTRAADGGKLSGSVLRTILMSYTYVAVWISLSFAVIVYNKYILSPSMYDWPFPISLTMIHMAFCSSLAFIMVRVLRVVEPVNMTAETYRKSVIPIGALYSMSLWFSNSAYIYLSVSFIQMLKALMPVAVYSLGILFKKETFSRETMITMVGISIGVGVAAYGELNFNVIGVTLQLGAIAFEATRLILIQILLTSKGLSMNPITSLYYIAPCCLVFLAVPWALVELPALMAAGSVRLDLVVFGTNAGVAFALNLAVFLLVGKTSALTMNVAGVVKDWLLITFSWSTIGDKISMVNLIGYGIAFLGVCYYNHIKLRAMKSASRAQSLPRSPMGKLPISNEESGPLLSHGDDEENHENLDHGTRK